MTAPLTAPPTAPIKASLAARLAARLAGLDRAFGAVLRFVPVSILIALTGLLAVNIVARYTGLFSFAWFDEVVATLFAWFVFIGAGALWREREHFAIRLLGDRLGDGAAGRATAILIAAIGAGFSLALLFFGWSYVGRVTATTPVLGLPQSWAYACLPIGGAIMTVYALRDLWQSILRTRPAETAD